MTLRKTTNNTTFGQFLIWPDCPFNIITQWSLTVLLTLLLSDLWLSLQHYYSVISSFPRGTLNKVDFSASIRNLSGGKSPSLYVLSSQIGPNYRICFWLTPLSHPIFSLALPFFQFYWRYGYYSKRAGLIQPFHLIWLFVKMFKTREEFGSL